ncbi:MAG: hypothetical protein HQM00_14215, partial [Magnetococcales bacterium]|nr:hypothetical protein [Magnetococcales bacterium]
ERIGLVLEEDCIVQVIEIWPEMIGETQLNVQVGSHATPDGAVTWSPPRSFDPAADEKVDVRVTGRYIAVRFTGAHEAQWALSGFALRYEVRGKS